MSKKEKLKLKLLNHSIDANELRTLLKANGWVIDRQKGSHQIWIHGSKTYNLSAHGKDLKPYQIREAISVLELEDN